MPETVGGNNVAPNVLYVESLATYGAYGSRVC